MKIVDVLAQDLSFVGSHAAGLVASVLPDLEFEIGAVANGAAIRSYALEELFGERAPAHQGDGTELLKNGFTGSGGSLNIHKGGDG